MAGQPITVSERGRLPCTVNNNIMVSGSADVEMWVLSHVWAILHVVHGSCDNLENNLEQPSGNNIGHSLHSSIRQLVTKINPARRHHPLPPWTILIRWLLNQFEDDLLLSKWVLHTADVVPFVYYIGAFQLEYMSCIEMSRVKNSYNIITRFGYLPATPLMAQLNETPAVHHHHK